MSFLGKVAGAAVLIGGTWAFLRVKDCFNAFVEQDEAETKFHERVAYYGDKVSPELVKKLKGLVDNGTLCWTEALARLDGAAM